MSRYMLDTNAVSDVMREPRGAVARQLRRVGLEQVCLSIVTAAELRFGAARSGSATLLERVEIMLDELAVLPFDVPADLEYGLIRVALEAEGRPIGPNDLLIAAHARALGAILVTADVDEFSRVTGLTIENWRA